LYVFSYFKINTFKIDSKFKIGNSKFAFYKFKTISLQIKQVNVLLKTGCSPIILSYFAKKSKSKARKKDACGLDEHNRL